MAKVDFQHTQWHQHLPRKQNFEIRFFEQTLIPDSSNTSRSTACSKVSPISRNPARQEYLDGGFQKGA